MSGGRPPALDVVARSQRKVHLEDLLQPPRVDVTFPALPVCRWRFVMQLLFLRQVPWLHSLASELPGEQQRQQHKWGEKSNAPFDRHTYPSEANGHGGQVLEAFLAELLAANGDWADAAQTRVDGVSILHTFHVVRKAKENEKEW